MYPSTATKYPNPFNRTLSTPDGCTPNSRNHSYAGKKRSALEMNSTGATRALSGAWRPSPHPRTKRTATAVSRYKHRMLERSKAHAELPRSESPTCFDEATQEYHQQEQQEQQDPMPVPNAQAEPMPVPNAEEEAEAPPPPPVPNVAEAEASDAQDDAEAERMPVPNAEAEAEAPPPPPVPNVAEAEASDAQDDAEESGSEAPDDASQADSEMRWMHTESERKVDEVSTQDPPDGMSIDVKQPDVDLPRPKCPTCGQEKPEPASRGVVARTLSWMVTG